MYSKQYAAPQQYRYVPGSTGCIHMHIICMIARIFSFRNIICSLSVSCGQTQTKRGRGSPATRSVVGWWSEEGTRPRTRVGSGRIFYILVVSVGFSSSVSQVFCTLKIVPICSVSCVCTYRYRQYHRETFFRGHRLTIPVRYAFM